MVDQDHKFNLNIYKFLNHTIPNSHNFTCSEQCFILSNKTGSVCNIDSCYEVMMYRWQCTKETRKWPSKHQASSYPHCILINDQPGRNKHIYNCHVTLCVTAKEYWFGIQSLDDFHSFIFHILNEPSCLYVEDYEGIWQLLLDISVASYSFDVKT